MSFNCLSSGQELWALGANEVHSFGGAGHDTVRFSVESGDFSESQVPDEPRGRNKASLRKAFVEEEEVNEENHFVFCPFHISCFYKIIALKIHSPL